jgi:uncharacterized protein
MAALVAAAFCYAPESQAAAVTAQSAPSFSCSSPDRIEAVICGDLELAESDRTMAQLYASAQTDIFGSGPNGQRALQRQWLKDRAKCAKEADSWVNRCLDDSYQLRLMDLAVASLFTAPDAALAEIGDQAPKLTPIYQAIYRYATIDAPSERARVVGDLIEPLFKAYKADAGQIDLLEGVSSAHAAAASDAAFANFLDAAVLVTDAPLRVVLPCAAFARRPGLIGALGPRFGSTMDNFLPDSDCEAMTSPLPEMDRLDQLAADAQPRCEGTIRFAAYREAAMALDQVRLNQLEARSHGRKHVVSGRERQFREAESRQIKATADELAAYYARVFHLPARVASSQGAAAVEAILDSVFNDFCGSD